VRPRHEDPEIPEDVQPGDLDRIARNELKTLSKDNAEGVAQHLVMAARLIEEDPELAHRHATSAARRAGRIAVVRESLAITAYAVGDYALALRELRTYRRISGKNDQLALMVDSERGQGRPDKALELGRSVPKETLPAAEQVALAIAMSGARLDLGQTEAALDELSIAQLNRDVAYSYSADLFHAYAEVLEELGRSEEAGAWRQRADTAEAAFADPDEGWDDMVEVVEEELESDERVEEDGTEDSRSEADDVDGATGADEDATDDFAEDGVDEPVEPVEPGDAASDDVPAPPSEDGDSEEIAIDVDDELDASAGPTGEADPAAAPDADVRPAADADARDGSARDGSADGGSSHDGSADGGSADGGSSHDGSADGGSADGGSSHGGSAGDGDRSIDDEERDDVR
jgi:tetratricopeptide (TPR) repeat protein